MDRATRSGWKIAAVCCLALCSAPRADAAIELVGVGEAVFQWQPATGPVEGYIVYLSEDGQPFEMWSWVTDETAARIPGSPGDSFRVAVAAFNAQLGVLGPLSPASDEIVFVAAPGGTPVPGTPPKYTPVPDDFNGDGSSDLLLLGRLQSLMLWTLEKGAVSGARRMPALGAGQIVVGTGDYNADGTSDLAVLDASGPLGVQLFANGSLVGGGELDASVAGIWRVACSGDTDADGDDEIAMHDPFDGSVELWHVSGAGLGSITPLPQAPSGASIVACGDYDGDGRDDLAWQNGGTVDVWLTTGPGSVTTARLASGAGANLVLVAAGDFDGDGRSDLLWNAGGELELWLLDRGLGFTPVRLGSGDVVASGDYDADGQHELMVRNGSSLERWLLDEKGVDKIYPVRLLDPMWQVLSLGELAPPAQN